MTPALRNACLADGTTRLVNLTERAYLKDDAARQAWLDGVVTMLDAVRSNRQAAYWQDKWRLSIRPACATILSAATLADLDAYIGIV